jgi:hypothetical protein
MPGIGIRSMQERSKCTDPKQQYRRVCLLEVIFPKENLKENPYKTTILDLFFF